MFFLFGVDEVYETYKEGGDWEAKAVGIGAETAIISAIGGALLILTPPGWIATIAVAVGEGIAYTAAGKFIEKYSEEGYEWISKNLHNW